MYALKPTLVLVNDLKPHEEFDEEHSQVIVQEIFTDGAINIPILADGATCVILDGHHRFSAAKKLKLFKIPVLLVDYLKDTVISVFSRRYTVTINKNLVIQAGMSGKLFQSKTTRHVLHLPYYVSSYKLSVLSGSEANK